MSDSTPIIDVQAVSKAYSRTIALDALNLTVEPGECLFLVGHNGAGKTTLFKALLGLIQPSAGRLTVRGLPPQHESNRWAVAYLPEVMAFPGGLTGLELLRFFADLKRRDRAECAELLALVGLKDAAGSRISTYSKGMRQRLGLAQVLLGQPEIILLDEPTSGLDPAVKKQFYRIIDDCRKRGATILISSHALSEIELLADRIAILKRGQLVQLGTVNELRARANLPIRFRLSGLAADIAEKLELMDQTIQLTHVNGQVVECLCSVESKMLLLRQFTQSGIQVDDIEVHMPKLDDLYMHFAGSEVDQ